MSTPSHPSEEIRQLFRKHVTEVAAGVVEVMSVARKVGDRVLVAVRSNDHAVDPVSVCVGKGGIHPKSMVRELGGEKLTIVLWSESPESFVLHAIGSLGTSAVRTPKVTLDAPAHRAKVEVGRETLAYFATQDGSRLRLASQLVGWDIQIVSSEHN